ncbi:MAG: hypothetical protein GYA62_16575 [Bacteroidales bacterium]|nr:hypothetical protein [Bacteroidales bacterium]
MAYILIITIIVIGIFSMKNNNNLPFFNSFFASCLILSLVEAFTYPGFIVKHFHIELFLGLLALFVGAYLFFLFLKTKKHDLLFIRFIAYVSLFAYLFGKVVGEITYPNFIFSHFHFQPNLMLLPVICSFLLFAINDNVSIKAFTNICVFLLICQYLASDFATVKENNIPFILNNLQMSENKKMENLVGKTFYTFSEFLVENTESNSTILIPPQGFPWPQSSNIAYFRYFLYPRNLINGKEKSSGTELDGVDYVILDYGETLTSEHGYTNVWPKFDVKGEYIIYWNPTTGEKYKDNTGVYKYNENNKSEMWGIIKIKH